LKPDGTVVAWGSNLEMAIGDGTGTDRPSPVPVCAPGATAPCTSFLSDITAIAAGVNISLALKRDGTVWAWGIGDMGMLGIATKDGSNTPAEVCAAGQQAPCSSFLTDVVAIAAGAEHSLALKRDGTVWAFGLNSSGQLGAPSADQCTSAGFNGTPGTISPCSLTPVKVTGLSGVKAIAAGASHNLALKRDGTVWTWGANHNAQLGNGTNTGTTSGCASPTPSLQILCGVQQAAPVAGVSGVVAVAAGAGHSLALRRDSSVLAWGNNAAGELGSPTTETCAGAPCSTRPLQVAGLSGVTAIAGGGRALGQGGTTQTIVDHSVALMRDRTVRTWGYNGSAQLGDTSRCTALPAPPAFPSFSCTNSTSPVPVVGLAGVTAISSGAAHMLALSRSIAAVSWGASGFGESGNGFVPSPCPRPTPTRQNPLAATGCGNPTPVVVAGLSADHIVALAAGGEATAALTREGTVWVWGGNSTGQMAIGNSPAGTVCTPADAAHASCVGSSIPVQVAALSEVKAIAAGGGHFLAL
jgi:alpha-tubulin suppressor-like RCC1 family protein